MSISDDQYKKAMSPPTSLEVGVAINQVYAALLVVAEYMVADWHKTDETRKRACIDQLFIKLDMLNHSLDELLGRNKE